MDTPLRIKTVEIAGFRCISELKLDFRDPGTGEAASFVAIVGPNGSGKTAILEAIVNTVRWELLGSAPDRPKRVVVEFNGGLLSSGVAVAEALREKLAEHVLYQPAFRDPQISGREVKPGAQQRLPSQMALSTRAGDTSNRAQTLHAWLARRQISRDRVPELWTATAPFLDGFEFYDLDPDSFAPRFKKGDVIINFSQLSGGQRMIVFNFAEILMQCGSAGLLLIDEPEQHLHPAWQKALPAALQSLIPDGQVIVATHSPYIIHGLAPHQVFMLGSVEGVPS